MRRRNAFVLATALASASSFQPPAAAQTQRFDEFPLAAEAAAGVEDSALRDLLVRHWDWSMRQHPVEATTLGDHRFDDLLDAVGVEAHAAQAEARREFLAAARTLTDRTLSERDRLTLELFIESLSDSDAVEVCQDHLWNVIPDDNPIDRFNTLPRRHTVKTFRDARNLAARYRQVASRIDAEIHALRAGIERGLVADARSIASTVSMIDGQLALPFTQWDLLEPTRRDLAGLSAEEQSAVKVELEQIVAAEIAPAYRRYRDFLQTTLLPLGREDERVGLLGLPNGKACYDAKIKEMTSLTRTPAELHALGLREMERINGEMRTLGEHVFGTRDLAAIIARLKSDPSLFFSSREELLAKADESLRRAERAVTSAFGSLPRAACTVVPIPETEAPYTTIAYYRRPHADGTKPGEYFVNAYRPETRARYEMEVLSFHESVPGHHLQISLAQELGDVPAFRKHGRWTAFVEGWGLYSERLADELGLYSSDVDRLGMLSFEAWRAGRLVVDTGLHAMSWTRTQAEDYFRRHTALTEVNITNEIDRYVTDPGQALAYKLGQLEILRLRELARDELGTAFDIKKFHDAVLGQGAVTLPVLGRQIENWYTAL